MPDEHNDGYTHECLHATSIIQEMVDTHIIETRCAEEFSDVMVAARAVEEKLWTLYSLISIKFKDEDNARNGEE